MATTISSLLTPRRWPVIAFLVSAALLGGAYSFQYIGGLAPCQMCYWQRHAHKAVLGASVLAMIAASVKASVKLRRALLGLITLCFIASFAIAFWHVGVEFKWWEGPKTCLVTAQDTGGFDPSSILDALNEPMSAPACSDIVWSMLGLSMAGWNALISGLAAIVSALAVLKSKESHE